MKNTRNTILILGGGFGGTSTALELERILKKEKLLDVFQIVLVDRNAYHLYTPALYEIATTLKLDANMPALKEVVTIPYADIFREKGISFLRGEIKKIDISHSFVTLEDHHTCKEIPYTFLVLALGSEVNYFNIPGLQDYSTPLKDLKDAIRLRDHIEHTFMNRERLNVIIGGGGTTGIEIAGALHGFLERLLRFYGPNHAEVKIRIIEAGPHVLAGFDKMVSNWAALRLKRLGIETITSTLITNVIKDTLVVKDSKTNESHPLPYSVLIWTGGVKVNRIIEELTIAKDVKNRCLVDTYLEVGLRKNQGAAETMTGPSESHPNIYAVGDNTCFFDVNRNALISGNAPYAITQGKLAALNIIANILKTPKIEYQPKTPPYVIPIGGKYAIADLGFVRFRGIIAWILKQFVEPNYYRRILPWGKVLPLWLKGLRLFLKND